MLKHSVVLCLYPIFFFVGVRGGGGEYSFLVHSCLFFVFPFESVTKKGLLKACVKCTCEWHCDRETEPSLCSMVLYANAATCFRDCISKCKGK